MKKTFTLRKIAILTIMIFGTCFIHAQVVTSSADDGSVGTLRSQIANAIGGATITFDPTVTNVILTTGQITIDKSLTLTGNGLLITTIDGNATGRIFDVTTGNFTISDLRITNGLATNGGAIQVLNSNLSLTNVRISNSTANASNGSGGALLIGSGSTLNALNSIFSGNIANRAGGAIEAVAGTTTMLTNVDFTSNNAGSAPAIATPGNGGAMHITGNAIVTITGGTVNNNIAAAEGGGLWNGTGTMTINGTTINGNTASGAASDNGGGGIYNLNGGTLNIQNAMITNNMATGTAGSGGGILNDVGSQLSVSNSTISGNTAKRAGGGIEDNSGTSTLTLTNVNLNNNSVFGPPGNGGGFHITGAGNATIIGGTVNGNSASLEGGGLWNGTGTMTINGTTINGNISTGNAADDGGAGIFNNGGTLNITNAMVTNNLSTGTSGSGGGLLSLAGIVTVLNSTFDGNSANRAGGAIEAINGTLNITTSSLINNDVDGTAGTPNPGNGGAIHISAITNTTINGGTVSGNEARREGGGLWNQTGSVMTINNLTVDSNVARGNGITFGGGGLFNNGGTMNVNSSTISNNSSVGTLGNGGGLHVKTGTATILTSTFSGNSSMNNGGGIFNNASLSLNAVTIANNNTANNGGGIANSSTSSPSLKNTIIATNIAGSGADLSNTTGIYTTNGYNLVGSDANNVFSPGSGDLEGVSPLIGALSNNGGTTFTHALQTNSPAYNFGDATDNFNDQIGNSVFGGRRDIGAFEAQSVLGIESNNFVNSKQSIVYPNPMTNGFLTIQLSSNFGEEASAKIIEIGSGKIINEFKIQSSSNVINLNNLSSGIYIIQLTTEKFTETHKLVVSK